MSKRKSTKHCCFVLFCGAPLVAITGQVGTDRMQLHDLYADPTHIAAAGQLISETKNPVILDFCQN